MFCVTTGVFQRSNLTTQSSKQDHFFIISAQLNSGQFQTTKQHHPMNNVNTLVFSVN